MQLRERPEGFVRRSYALSFMVSTSLRILPRRNSEPLDVNQSF
jgi:hypothetical protein